tara:strand:- start:16394 stop:16675 length:282 start_codon:yes stop_codon:yes gene_type:complete
MHKKSASPDVIEFQGIELPHLTEESVIQYQSTCINLLIDASANPEGYADGDILSAITVLRFQEQNDGECIKCPASAYLLRLSRTEHHKLTRHT